MKLYKKIYPGIDYLQDANTLIEPYSDSVIFHGYWNGDLTQHHLSSIKSCYFFNVHNNKHKIILWLENNNTNNFNTEIAKYAEIKNFNVNNELKDTFLENESITYIGGSANGLSEKANFYRMLLLYKYGGCWFDLDCFFMRCFDPLFSKFKDDISLYEWEKQNYPNNAIFISLDPYSQKMKDSILYILKMNNGWGFQRAKLCYNIQELDFLVLPCIWFDAGWIKTATTKKESFTTFLKNTEEICNFDNFFPGAFCYHWHNQWKKKIEDTSILKQLTNIIDSRLDM